MWTARLPLLPTFFFGRHCGKNSLKTQKKRHRCAPRELKKSATSGAHPSCPSGAWDRVKTSELANDLAHEMDNILIHLRRQAKKAEPFNSGGASWDLDPARAVTKSTDYVLHRPPTTTRRHRLIQSGSEQHRTVCVSCVGAR